MSKSEFSSILAKKLIGESTEDEERRLEEIIRSDEAIKQQYILLNEFLQGDTTTGDDIERAFDIVLNKAAASSGVSGAKMEDKENVLTLSAKRLRIRYLKMVAAVLLLVVAVWYMRLVGVDNSSLTNITKANTKYWQIRTNTEDEKMRLVLDDGTEIYLRKGSTVRYNHDFGTTRRDVFLEGEAFFDVAKNENVPMVVHANNIEVKVKGTAFNITAYPGDAYVSTALVRGAVEVTNKDDPGRVIYLKPNEKLIVKATTNISNIDFGKNYKYTRDDLMYQPYVIKSLQVEPVSSLVPELSWMDHKLVFNRESFGELANRMERWYGVKIYFENKDIQEQVFTGVFENESLEQSLDALKLSYPFCFTIEMNNVFIRRNGF